MMRITCLISYAFGDECDSTTFVSLFSSAFTARPYQVRYFLRLDDVCINKSKNRLVDNGQTNVSIANCRIYDIVILNVCSFQTHLFLFVPSHLGLGLAGMCVIEWGELGELVATRWFFYNFFYFLLLLLYSMGVELCIPL